MSEDKHSQNNSSISATIIFGKIIGSMPRSVINYFLSNAMKLMVEDYSEIFDRLRDCDSPSFLIIPEDLDFAFYMRMGRYDYALRVVNKVNNIDVDVSISAQFHILINALEGDLDGDALFFSKDLKIDGNTNAAVALRNALDSQNINVFDTLISNFGSLSPLAKIVFEKILSLYSNLNKSIESMHALAFQNVNAAVSRHNRDIDNIKDELYTLNRDMIKMTRGPIRKKEKIS